MFNKLTKIFAFVLVILLCLVAFAACKGDEKKPADSQQSQTDNNGGNGNTDNNDNKNDPAFDNVFWAEGVKLSLVVGTDVFSTPDDIAYVVMDETGATPSYKSPTSTAEKHEIIVGRAERAISKTAYRLLEQNTDLGFESYVIYSDGTSVAIAFSCVEAYDMALELLEDELLVARNGKITFDSGVVVNEHFNLNERLDELDAILKEEKWAKVEKRVNELGYDGKATVDAFKQLFSLYSDDAYIWLANLYEPDIYSETRADDEAPLGGFYYSNSARNTVTFLPDVETTRQALDFIRYSGMAGSLKEALSPEMKNAMINFVRSLYDPTSGNFYHPQWSGLEYTDERLGRDYTNAMSVLSTLGGSLKVTSVAYLTTDGALTASLRYSGVQSVSKVVATAALPHLVSEAAFIEYLDKQNWNDSYTTGNRIAAQGALIDNAGLMDVCLDYLDKKQNPANGMWSLSSDDNAVNGFLKISALYSSYAPGLDRTMNYAVEAAATCEAILLSDAEPATVCWVYNVWYSLGNIIGLLSQTGSAQDLEAIDQIRDSLRKNAPEYIRIAAEKYAPFRKDDGSFSFSPDQSSSNSQGMPVCPSNQNEGDVNATYISIVSVPARIFAALGYNDVEVEVFTPNDFKIFIKELESMGPVIKSNTEFGGALQFNGTTLDGLLHSADYTEIDTAPDKVEEDGYAFAEIIEDGADNRVLHFGKVDASKGFEPKLSFRLIDPKGTRYIYEMKIKFNGANMEGNSWHTRFTMYGGSGRFWYMLAYTNSKGQLCLDSLNEPLAVLDPGKYYTLRFEYYYDSAESAVDKICKVYVDGNYVGDGGVSGSAGKDSQFYRCMMEFRAQATDIDYFIDDINTTRDYEAYVAPPPPDFNDATGEYYTDATIKKDRYDYDAEEPKMPTLGNNNGSALMYADSENGTLVFKKTNVAGEDYIKFTSAFNDAFWKFTNKATFVEFDLKYSNITATTPMKWRFAKDIVVSKSGDSLAMSMPSVAGNSPFNLDTTSNTWYNIRLEQYWYKADAEGNSYSLIKVFVNGNFKGEFKTNYNSASSNFLIYLLASETTAELVMDNVLVANIDKPYVSEDAPSGGDNPGASDEEYAPSAEILAVKGGANGIVVLMHDDGDINSAKILDSLYAKYGIKGDVAMVVSKLLQAGTTSPEVVTVNFWKQLINTGRWNIVNHSYTHTWWGEDADALEKEIVTSQQILKNLFTTRKVLTYAYPGFSANVGEIGKDLVYQAAYEIIGNYYIGARDYEGRTTSLSGINWLDVNSCSIGESWASSAMNDIDSAIAGGKMAVVFMHRVVETETQAAADTSATTKAKMEEIISKISSGVEEGKIWNAFFEEAILYLREAESSSVSVSGDAEALRVTLTDTLEDSIYNYPLSVRIEVPASWLYAKVTQGDKNEYLTAYNLNGKWVVDASIVPDGGVALVTSIAKHDIPTDTTVEAPKEEMLEMPPFDAGDATGDYFKDPDNAGLRVDFDSILTNIPEDTDAKDFLSIKDGYLLFDDGEQENSAKYIRYRYNLPSGYSSFASLCTVFEFDMNLKQAYSSYPIQIKLADTMYTIYYSKVDDVFKLCMQVNGEDIPLGISMNTWATVRLEHYYSVTHADGTTTGVLQVYVNNEAVFELRTEVKSANNAAIIYMTRVERNSTSDADLKLDNIFLGHFDKAYNEIVMEKPEPTPDPEPDPTPDPEPSDSDASGDFYLSNTAGNRFDYDEESPAMPDTLSLGSYTTAEVKDGALVFSRISGTQGEGYLRWNVSSSSYENFVFETDAKFESFTRKGIVIKMLVQLGGVNEQINMEYADAGMKIYLSAGVGSVTVPYGEWVNIRFEFDVVTREHHIFLDNEYAATLKSTATATTSSSRVLFYLLSNGYDGVVSFDNIFYGFVAEGSELPLPPVEDAVGEYYLNSDKVGTRYDYDEKGVALPETGYSETTGSFAIVDGSLMFEDGDAESKEMYAKFAGASESGYNCTVVEFDCKISQVYGSYPIQVKVANNNLTLYYMDQRSYDASYGTGYKLCLLVDGKYVPIGATAGSWFNIRFEHYYDVNTVKVYVNNEFVVDMSVASGSAGSAVIYLTSNERSKGSNADLYIDNVYVGHVKNTFTAADSGAKN